MRKPKRRSRTSRGHTDRSWPVLLLLVLLILVPTVCVLWFMSVATKSEHLAVREKLREAYQGHLSLVRERLNDHWTRKLEQSEQLAANDPSSAVFDSCVRAEMADSVLCFDSSGRLSYPSPTPVSANETEEDTAWSRASHLEHVRRQYVAAAEAYETIAKSSLSRGLRDRAARAWQASARCHAQAGDTKRALEILKETLHEEAYALAKDLQSRLIVADAELRVLELTRDQRDADFVAISDQLTQRVLDYENSPLTAAQRRFLMNALQALRPELQFPTLSAERLAAEFIESQPSPPTKPVLYATGLRDVWQIASTGGRVLMLLEEQTLLKQMRQVLAAQTLPPEISVDVLPPTTELSSDSVFTSLPAGARLPGWRLTLSLKDPERFDAASSSRVTAYFWTGVLGIATISVLALVIGRTIRHQTQLAQLKNDLVATITHELKTPLSSMRLLVDTLLDADRFNEEQVREYLQLIGKENTRLSRLIDNFLAFSRLERNKYAFEFAQTSPADVVNAAAESVHERFQTPGCEFSVQVEPELPPIVADLDALVTVLLNLLDNAYKYSGTQKCITLKAYRDNDHVCFAVEDDGLGLSSREQKRIFKRFYQVSQPLSRQGSGCGLGLSIVQYIVNAHGGTIRVTSQPEQGSTFTISVPRSITPSRQQPAPSVHEGPRA